jgi:hypothetical protein
LVTRFHRPGLRRRALPLIALTCLLLVMPALSVSENSRNTAKISTPDVLVLVYSQAGPFDQVSINYNSKVPKADAERDIAQIRNTAGWMTRNQNVSTEKATAPGAKPTTSSRFETVRLANQAEGTLPLEPFITALKRFRAMQVIYLISGPFEFHGLKDFENDNVKILLRHSTGSYTYHVTVKNSDFDRLRLPLKAERPAAPRKSGMSTGLRLVFVLGIAAAGGALAYIIAALLSRNRRHTQ